MIFKNSIFVLVTVFLFMSGCSEESPKKIPLEEKVVDTNEEIAPINKDSFRPQLDVLFVIDDSGSMLDHQQNLKLNISKFADALVSIKYLDYHVGVITSTITNGGKLRGNVRYVERLTPDGINVLSQNLLVGISGSGTEMFFDPINLALTEPVLSGYNLGFYRKNASLAIIFLTDTEDQSAKFTAVTMHNFLLSLKGNPEKLIVAAAHIGDKDLITCPTDYTEVSIVKNRNGLEDFFKLTNATTFTLCDDFGENLADLGEKIAAQSQRMYLKKMPVVETIKIFLDGVELPSNAIFGWTYDASNNSIVFGAGIDWDMYPAGAYPQVEFEVLKQTPKD